MTRGRSLLLLLSVIVFGAAFSTFARADDGDKMIIDSRWSAGRYALRQDILISSLDSVDKRVESRTQTRAFFSWDIVASPVENGVQRLTLQASRVLLRYEGDGQELFFADSSDELNGKAYVKAVYKHFLSVPIVVCFKDGVAESVEGCEKFWETLPEAQSQDDENFLLRLKSVASPASFIELFRQLDYPLTDAPVASGDEWKTQTRCVLPNVGDVAFDWNCQLKSVANVGAARLATVAANSDLDLDISELIKAEVKTEIEAKFDLNAPRPVEFSSRTTATVHQLPDAEKKSEVKTVSLIRINLTVVKR